MFVDTHAHLSDPRFAADVDKVIESASASGVERIINPVSDLHDAKRMAKLIARYPNVYGLVGLYPGASENKSWREDLVQLENMLVHNNKILGIGEIGLDVYWMRRNPKLEMEIFAEQLRMAARLELPVVIHNRGCEKEIREVLAQLEGVPHGQFHCFSGDRAWLDYVLALGFYVGFDGNITYPSNKSLRELSTYVPADRLLLETDSPYLPPEGKRGERNEPGNVRITAQKLADLRGVTLKELGEQTTENAKRLFGI